MIDISIHALLAESDSPRCGWFEVIYYFYPRSPCGERHYPSDQPVMYWRISIHALLAESDDTILQYTGAPTISIHALLAESDSKSAQNSGVLLRI